MGKSGDLIRSFVVKVHRVCRKNTKCCFVLFLREILHRSEYHLRRLATALLPHRRHCHNLLPLSCRAEAWRQLRHNAYPSSRSFLRFAKWAEYEAKDIDLARTVYESSLVELEPGESQQARVFGRFAAFEERQGEHERARIIYKHATKLLNLGQEGQEPKAGGREVDGEEDEVPQWKREKRAELYKAFIAFEKKRGDKAGIEDIVITGQCAEYERRVAVDPTDYDAWFEYAKMEEENETGR